MLHSHKPADPEGLVKDLAPTQEIWNCNFKEASLLVHEF